METIHGGVDNVVYSFLSCDAVVNLVLSVEAKAEEDGFHWSEAELLIVNDKDTVYFVLLELFEVINYLEKAWALITFLLSELRLEDMDFWDIL